MTLFALLSLLIALTAAASYLNYRYIRLPTTVGVMLVAMVASLIVTIAGPHAGGFEKVAGAIVARVDFDQVVLHGMLAFLLFAGAIHLDLSDLSREWLPIALLAFAGTLASTFLVGGMMHVVLGWLGTPVPLVHALLFGALISPTDPIAVLAIMKSVGTPKRLETQMAGESLFNDGIGVVVFLVLLELTGAGAGRVPGVAGVGALLLKEVGGGLLIGVFSGLVAYHMLRRVDDYQVEVLITLALAMGCYALADALHLSAPIAVVVAGLFIGNHGRALAMSASTREHVDTFWELVDEILNAVLFLLIGLELLVLPLERRWVLAGAIAVAVVLLARLASVVGLLVPLDRVRPQPRGAVAVLTWGALRGGISVAMALSLPPGDSRSLLLTVTYCVVVFSILVQGLTISRVIARTTTPGAGGREAGGHVQR